MTKSQQLHLLSCLMKPVLKAAPFGKEEILGTRTDSLVWQVGYRAVSSAVQYTICQPLCHSTSIYQQVILNIAKFADHKYVTTY